MAFSSKAQDCTIPSKKRLSKTTKDYVLVPEQGLPVKENYVIKLSFLTKPPKKLGWNQVAIPVHFNEVVGYQVVLWKLFNSKQEAHTTALKIVQKYKCKDYQIITVFKQDAQ